MDDPNTICIHSITFDEKKGPRALQYPKYEDLINYELVSCAVRDNLQVEPAFQFSKETCETFTFSMEIAEGQEARFAVNENGIPHWTECTTGSSVLPCPVKEIKVDPELKICTVTVAPNDWRESAKVIVLRIFCTVDALPSTGFDPQEDLCELDGISLTLVKPGNERVANPGDKAPSRIDPLIVTVDILEVSTETTSSFNIFQKRTFPSPIVPEPAFRSSPCRPDVHLQLVLQSCDTESCFHFLEKKDPGTSTPHPDGVELVAHNYDGARPNRLSAVKISGDRKSINFSWFRGKKVTPSVAYGFSAQVQKVDALGNFLKLEEIYIDPVIFHDPPLFPVFDPS
jgi:hypothetical protein